MFWFAVFLMFSGGVIAGVGGMTLLVVDDATKPTRPAPFLAPKSEPKFSSVVQCVAHDMTENPDDWEFEEIEEPYRRGIYRHKSGCYTVHDRNEQHAKLIHPTGFEHFKGLDKAVHAWHIAELRRHFGKMPDSAQEAARAEVNALVAATNPVAFAAKVGA